MISNEETIKIMEKQGYRFVGTNAAVKICGWTKKSLIDEGVCYKEKFYGIKSHRCCQMSPWLGCDNKCIHCWRALELDFNKIINQSKIKDPREIINGCINAQRTLLNGFGIKKNSRKKQLSKANMEKFREAQEPMQFAISLSGEPTMYKDIGGLIEELRKRGKTSFLVTNGLYPEKIKELEEKEQLPTQLYISVNASNKETYKKIHRSSKKDAWERLNKSLKIMSELKGKTRTVFRINLIKGINSNMKNEFIPEYVELIKKSLADFVEIKGYRAMGFARNRKGMGYEAMPTHKEVKEYAKRIAEGSRYQIEDESKPSCVVLLKRDSSVKRFI